MVETGFDGCGGGGDSGSCSGGFGLFFRLL